MTHLNDPLSRNFAYSLFSNTVSLLFIQISRYLAVKSKLTTGPTLFMVPHTVLNYYSPVHSPLLLY